MNLKHLVIPVGNVSLKNPIPENYLDSLTEKILADREKSERATKLNKLIAQVTKDHPIEEREERMAEEKSTDIYVDEEGVKRGPNGRRLKKDGTERKARSDVGKKRATRKKKV